MRLTFDIETDGLDATKIWCLVMEDIDTGRIMKYTDHSTKYNGEIKDGLAMLKNAELLVAHNGIGFDALQILKIYGLDLYPNKFFDTWIASQVLNYRRPHKHGLAGWGEHLGYPKFTYDDWSGFTDEMMTYCVRDVQLNTVIFKKLMEELTELAARQPLIRPGLSAEMEAAKFDAYCRLYGWQFDETKAKETLKQLLGRMKSIESAVEPHLPPITRYIDKVPKTPKFTKKGEYTATTARMLSEYVGREVKPTDTHVLAAGREFQRKTIVKATLGNMDQVKEYLYSIGWEPDDWKMERGTHGWEKKSPKLTSTSLAKCGEHGKMIDEWTTLRSRKGVLEGWLDQLKDGRLHGRLWVVGTPTFRCRHEVIANLPAVTAPWGKELRELLVAEPGRNIVGADSSGNQFRSLAHYVNSPDLTNQILSGDIHQYNADIIGTDRRTAKTWIYAFLFGAGPTKLGQVLTGKKIVKAGNESIEKYGDAIPGLKILKDRIEDIWKQTSYTGPEGYIPGLDGRKVYTPQPYQTLNYLLQSCEAITTKSAVAYQIEKIREEGLDAQPRLYYHDEVAWSVAEKDSARVLEILTESFAEGPKRVGVQIMDGEGSIGKNYADVH
jgi:DNA polymerase-1